VSFFTQGLLDLHDELIVDLFAGGGGASCGIEMATGRQVDIAINHDPAAVSMHQANHPQTEHHVSDVFEADPRVVTAGRRVGLLWASPACTHHSKARGGKSYQRDARKSRALAWVVTRWAGQVRPRVIILENVEEFASWGPLVGPPNKLAPCPMRKGRTFRRWVRSLEQHGYRVEWRELRGCDYGAPTTRKRLFLIARCDGLPVVWPEPTHGPGRTKPYRAAAECIDWSIPSCSIFATPAEARSWAREHGQATPVRPLADATMRRVARGVMKYVVNNPKPFVVQLRQEGEGDAPLASPFLTEHAQASNQRTFAADEPLRTICAGVKGGHFSLIAPTLVATGYSEAEGQGDRRFAEVSAFLVAYYGTDQTGTPRDPLATITTHDRHGLVTVQVGRRTYAIEDIALRMLQPRELYRAQGFPDGYVIDRGADGRKFTKTQMVHMVGNSVVPQLAAALVRANAHELIVRDRERRIA
jgi:DNA (cytosine-5)-methyltransferase 1